MKTENPLNFRSKNFLYKNTLPQSSFNFLLSIKVSKITAILNSSSNVTKSPKTHFDWKRTLGVKEK
jgi:hypothetical protein